MIILHSSPYPHASGKPQSLGHQPALPYSHTTSTSGPQYSTETTSRLVKTDLPRGRDFITIATFSREEIEPIIDLAPDCKRQLGLQESHRLLEEMTPPMMLYAMSRAPGTASKPR